MVNMIYTTTFNPSLDYHLHVPQFRLQELNRADQSSIVAGGKGINVSRVLKNLGGSSIASGFVAGFTGNYILQSLEHWGMDHFFMQVDGLTRINIKLNTAGKETEIAGVSPTISTEQWNELVQMYQSLQSHDILVLSGSLPLSLPHNSYSLIMSQLHPGVKVVVDTSGVALKDAINYKPWLIKPNHHELSQLFNQTIANADYATYAHLGRLLIDQGVQQVLISLGGDGALLVTSDGAWIGHVPSGQVHSTVGAGDSMVAGFVYSYQQGYTLLDQFAYALACGSATAFSDDLCQKDGVEDLRKKIIITPL
jgi:1-phosphofructokinase